MSDEATIEIEHTLSRQFEDLDAASKEWAAELWRRDGLTKIVQQALEGQETPADGSARYQIVSVIRNLPKRNISIEMATRVVVDTIGKCVANTPGVVESADSEPKQERVEKMDDAEEKRQNDLATLFNLPSFREVIEGVAEHQKIYFDPQNRLPEEFIDFGGGAGMLKIPRHKR